MLATGAAPTIVRATSLMPVRRIVVPPAIWVPEQGSGFGSCLKFENCSLWRAANHVDWRHAVPPGIRHAAP